MFGDNAYRTANVSLLKDYLSRGYNIYLIGPHGIGKTEMVKQAAESLGWKCMEFNTALMDPFIDMTGIPQTVEKPLLDSDGKPIYDDNGNITVETVLKMVRKQGLEEADVIFFDEFRRARADTLNTVMNVINDRKINDELLPNLKCCVAASNPTKDELTGTVYNASYVDDAILDRFDIFLSGNVKVDVKYLTKALLKYNTESGINRSPKTVEDIAHAIGGWQHNLDFTNDSGKARAPYVSPRRCEKMARMYLEFATEDIIRDCLGSNSMALNIKTLSDTLEDIILNEAIAIEDSEIPVIADHWYELISNQVNSSNKKILIEMNNVYEQDDSEHTKMKAIIQHFADRCIEEDKDYLSDMINIVITAMHNKSIVRNVDNSDKRFNKIFSIITMMLRTTK